MSTDIFLGGLASLVLVAIIIVSLTSGQRSNISASHHRDAKRDNAHRKKSDR